MRILCLTLLGVVLTAAPAAAFSIAMEEPGVATPLGAGVDAPITIAGSCGFDNGTLEVRLGMSSGPPWLTGSADRAGGVHPDRLNVTAADCVDGNWTRTAVLHFGASDEAPAFEPAPVVVWARVGDDMVEARTNVTAGFFARLRMSPDPSLEVEPGRSGLATVHVENTGNGPVRVSFTLVQVPGDWNVVPPPLLRMEALRDGGVGQNVTLAIHPVTSALRGNVAETLEFLVTAVHAEDADLGRTSETIRINVHVTGTNVPAPGAALAALGVTAAAWRRTRWA